jgi:tetratricopeptide (TPR) repeat protein
MNKPFNQKITEKGGWLLTGMILLGGFFDTIINAATIITFPIAACLTLFFFALYPVWSYLLRKKRIKWLFTDQALTITDIGEAVKWKIAGAMILLWLPVIYQTGKNLLIPSAEATVAIAHKQQPLFDQSESRFKVLILPFDKECDDEGYRDDVGKVLYKRLTSLANQDSLAIKVEYLDLLDHSILFRLDMDSTRKYHHADQIIYGSYAPDDCAAGTKGKICFNYRVDDSVLQLGKRQSNTAYEMMDFTGMNAIRQGMGQEDIDYIIYLVTVYASFESENYQFAEKQLKKIKHLEESDELLALLGASLISSGKYSEAAPYLEKASLLNPNDNYIFNNLGCAYMFSGEHDKAIEPFRKGLKINPDDTIINFHLALLYDQLEDYENAKLYSRKAIELAPKDDRHWKMMARLYWKTGEYTEAMACILNSIDLNKKDWESWLYLGRLFKANEDINKAIACFKYAVLLNPGHAHGLVDLGTAYFEINNSVKSREALERALKLDTTIALVWNMLATIYLDSGNPDTAKKYYSKGLELNPNHEISWCNAARADLILKDTNNALTKLNKAISINSGDVKVYELIAHVYFRIGNYKEAEKYVRKILKKYPTHTIAQTQLGCISFLSGHHREAVGILNHVIETDSTNYTPFYLLATIYSFHDDKPGTLFHLEKATSINNIVKINAKKDPVFEWLWDDEEFKTITTVMKDEILSKDNSYLTIQFKE